MLKVGIMLKVVVQGTCIKRGFIILASISLSPSQIAHCVSQIEGSSGLVNPIVSLITSILNTCCFKTPDSLTYQATWKYVLGIGL